MPGELLKSSGSAVGPAERLGGWSEGQEEPGSLPWAGVSGIVQFQEVLYASPGKNLLTVCHGQRQRTVLCRHKAPGGGVPGALPRRGQAAEPNTEGREEVFVGGL